MEGRWSLSRSSVYLTFSTHQVNLSASLTLEWAGTSQSTRTMARRRPGREEPKTSSRATNVGTQWQRCWIRFVDVVHLQIEVDNIVQWLKIMKVYSSNRGFELYKDIKVTTDP